MLIASRQSSVATISHFPFPISHFLFPISYFPFPISYFLFPPSSQDSAPRAADTKNGTRWDPGQR
ncbi:MAG: hypothetical protein E6R14_11175 [Thermomicrobiales bacterium]|nr:MAG: hypothetical protein E6R14_11175 [Thermomicrobiales bacterium]